jgi:hypothetical protein
MSEVPLIGDVAAARPTAHPAAAARSLRAHPARRAGYGILGLQLALALAWSTVQYDRFALTFDFTIFHQAWYLIAHGDLNPWSTIKLSYFWQDHSELIMWPLALLYWVWPHSVVLLWAQDIAVVGAEAVAFTWLGELAERRRPGTEAQWFAWAGLILLVANPWIWWTISWDFHSETLAMPFAVLLARDLCNGRRRAWAWVLPLLACGDVAATYLAAIGFGAFLAARCSRTRGAVLALIGIAALVIITLIHGNIGSGDGLQDYAYLASTGPVLRHLSLGAMAKGILLRPLPALRKLQAHIPDIWANLAPSGLLGAGWVWLLPMALNVVLANNLFPNWLFAAPGFQSLPLYILMPVGTVAVLTTLARRRRRIALLLTALVVAQAVGYAAIWLPRTPAQWLRVPAATAATLAAVAARIPASAEVIASQGIIGRFAGRTDIQVIYGPGTEPVRGGETWFVIAPSAGIETLSPAGSLALIASLARLHATLVTHANGVWAFRWRPPPGTHEIVVPQGVGPLPAWTHSGATGRAVLTGPVGDWHVTSTGKRGYVSDGLEWQERAGRYEAQVSLSASGPVNVEVWDDTGNVLLARQSIPATDGVATVAMAVDATTDYRAAAYSGWGPFRATFEAPPPGQRLEVRIWSPGGEVVNVYQARLVTARSRVTSFRVNGYAGGQDGARNAPWQMMKYDGDPGRRDI